MADLVARIAADHDRPFRHPVHAAAIGRADQVPRAAANIDQPTMQLGADPIAGITTDMNLATS